MNSRPDLKVVKRESDRERLANAGGGDSGGRGERLARLEEKVTNIKENMATKTDIANLKTLIEKKESTAIKWIAGLLVTAIVGLGVAMVRTFFWLPPA